MRRSTNNGQTSNILSSANVNETVKRKNYDDKNETVNKMFVKDRNTI